MDIINNLFEMKAQYDAYLNQHIGGVKESFRQAKGELIKKFGIVEVDYLISKVINKHDASKYNEEEYDPYMYYFYGPDKKTKEAEEEFDMAWLHHQKHNPHHWQYWVIIRDSGELAPMDMPNEYIVEMLCDWNSFSLRDPESTAKKWYYDNKDKMVFSDNTRKIVEELLELPTFTNGIGKKDDSNESTDA